MSKKEFDEKTCTDSKGYLRWKSNNKLVHRWIARKNIWEKNRKKYPLEFKEYQVHHKDKNKKNNKIENLELKSIREHEAEHNLIRYEYPIIKTFLILGLLGLIWFSYLGWTSGYKFNNRDILFMMSTFILAIIGIYLINKKKKGARYI